MLKELPEIGITAYKISVEDDIKEIFVFKKTQKSIRRNI